MKKELSNALLGLVLGGTETQFVSECVNILRRHHCKRGNVPTWLFSDFALDVANIRENPGVPLLWHTHDAGTYLHFLEPDIEKYHKSYEQWKADFLKFDDWEFTELNYKWGYSNGHKHPMERIYFYDGEYFREVSRDTANLIWQYFGKTVIMEREEAVTVEVVA